MMAGEERHRTRRNGTAYSMTSGLVPIRANSVGHATASEMPVMVPMVMATQRPWDAILDTSAMLFVEAAAAILGVVVYWRTSADRG